jgi:hypothetical protein
MAEHDDVPPIRASNADREAVAAHLSAALAEGRLTPQEAEERLAACYAAKYQPELATLTKDLPRPAPVAKPPPARSAWLTAPLIAHAGVASLLSVLLVVGWAVVPHVPADIDPGRHGDGPEFQADFFWPIFPIFWLAVSVLIHAAVRINRSRTD